MPTTVNKIFVYFFSACLLACAGVAAYIQQPWLLLLPLGVILCLCLVQYPYLLFYCLMAAIPWSIEFNFNGSWGTDLPDEPLMLLTSFAVLCWVIFHRNRIYIKRWAHPLLIILALQMLWIMVSVVTSTHPLISIKYVLAKYWYLLAFVGAPLVLFRDTRHLKRSLAVLLFSMMAVMLLTLVRHAQNGWTFEKINDSLTPFYRNHVNYSSLLVVMVPLLIAFIRLSENSWKKRLLIVLLIITLAALYFSYARGAWLALITGWLAYVLLKKRLLPVSFFLFFALAAAAFWWLKEEDHYVQYASDYRTTIFHKNFSEHMIATYKLKDMSTVERFYRWVAGVRMIKDSWKTGFGPNTFYENYKSYTTPAFKTWVSKNEEHSTVHNYFLLLIIEQGVMGLLLFLMLIGAMFWYAQTIYHRTDHPFWKTVALTTASVLMMVCTINFLSDMIETDKVGSIFYLCLGGIVIADLRTRREMIDN